MSWPVVWGVQVWTYRALLLVTASVLMAPWAPMALHLDPDGLTYIDTGAVPGDTPAPALPALDGAALGSLTSHLIEVAGPAEEGGAVYCAMGSGMCARFDAKGVTYSVGGASPGDPRAVYTMSFDGARSVAPSGSGPLGHRTSFLLGDDPASWVHGAPDFRSVVYYEPYDGIDIAFTLMGGRLKYDILVAPRADPDAVRFAFDGVDGLCVDPLTGDLVLRTAAGEVRDSAPVAFQEGRAGRDAVGCGFAALDGDRVGFHVRGRDPTLPLTIDPSLNFGTFVGSSEDELGRDLRVDSAGNVYVVGYTSSSGFPIMPGAYDSTWNGDADAFLLKLKPDGSDLLSSTFIGGSGDDWQMGMFLLGSGEVLMAGETLSTDFPTKNANDPTANGDHEAYLLKVNAAGDDLVFSTYFGGSGRDRGWRVGQDAAGDVYLSGTTWDGIPSTAGTYQQTFGGNYDAFLTKFNASDYKLMWATHLGGAGMDAAESMVVTAGGDVYLTGQTQSGITASADAYDRSPNGGLDVYVAELSADGASLLHATYIGGSSDDQPFSMTIDTEGEPYVCGHTQSNNFPMLNALDNTLGGSRDIFVCKLDADLTALRYSTYIGGSDEDMAMGIAIDVAGYAHITGRSMSDDYPVTANALYKQWAGDNDAIYAKIAKDGSALLFSTYLGGTQMEQGAAIALRGATGVVICGYTYSPSFPTKTGSYDTSHNGGIDAFVISVSLGLPPAWLALSTLHAVEDVPLNVSFRDNVTDPDTPIDDLSITSTSPFVAAIDKLNVTFTFPNGVLAASVGLSLTDGSMDSLGVVNFTVDPVNDAPQCTIPVEWTAVEDEPRTINLTANIVDHDNDTSELSIDVSDPYATARGLELTVLFPEGMLEHTVHINVTDGLLRTPASMHFTVTPVDDLPTIDPLEPFTAIEDMTSVLNLTPFLHDIDTPVEELRVLVRERNCTVQGQELRFLFPLGGFSVTAPIEVTDAHGRAYATLTVTVEERNDPPIVHGVSPKLFVENEQKTIDLGPYIEDEDTPFEQLTLSCDDPHVVRVEGMNLTLLYTRWMPEHTVFFNASDGLLRTEGGFEVQVEEVNDPPVVAGLIGMPSPVLIVMNEDEERWFQLDVTDEESTVFRYGLAAGSWDGVSVFQNGSVRVTAPFKEVGNFTATVSVDDQNGGVATLLLEARVENVNDPPSMLSVTEPANHTIVEEGTNVTFAIGVYDPDAEFGQVLRATWTSNVSGTLRELTTPSSLSFTTDALAVGSHLVTVTVSDGQYAVSAWFDLTVLERYVPPPPPPEEPSFLTGSAGIALAVVVLAIIGVVVAVVVIGRSRRKPREEWVEEAEGEEEAVVVPLAPAVPSSAGGPAGTPARPIAMEGDLARLNVSLSNVVAQLEAQRASEASVAPAAAPAPPVAGPAAPLTEEEEADRERTREVREVMRALTQLPQGLPTSLSGWDIAELARTIVDGEGGELPDGAPVVRIKGHWYNSDRTNVGTFMRESRGPGEAATATTPEEESTKKLTQLENLLLEGRISEDTYRELKHKYEE